MTGITNKKKAYVETQTMALLRPEVGRHFGFNIGFFFFSLDILCIGTLAIGWYELTSHQEYDSESLESMI